MECGSGIEELFNRNLDAPRFFILLSNATAWEHSWKSFEKTIIHGIPALVEVVLPELCPAIRCLRWADCPV
jgi:hypothetical protein